MSDNPLDNIGQPNPAPAPQEDLLPKAKENDEKCAEFSFTVSWKNGDEDRGPDFIGVQCNKDVRDYVYPEQTNPTIENIKNYIINPPNGHTVERGWIQSLPENLDNVAITEIKITAPVEVDCPPENEDDKPLVPANPEAGDGGQPEPKPEEIVGFEIDAGAEDCDPKTIPINIAYSSDKIPKFLDTISSTIKQNLFQKMAKLED